MERKRKPRYYEALDSDASWVLCPKCALKYHPSTVRAHYDNKQDYACAECSRSIPKISSARRFASRTKGYASR